jgi:hypothetical protein
VHSHPIVGTVIAELDLGADERGVVRRALEGLVRERRGARPAAVLTNPVHIGIATKP